jgi:hypothetical protein
VQAHNDYEINRKTEEDGGFAGLKSCATYEALRGHPENPPGTVLFFRLQSGAMSTGRLNARCLKNQLFSETLRLIALIEEAAVIERILRHLHLPIEVPTPRPGRAPPLLETCSFNQDTDIAGFNSCARSACAGVASPEARPIVVRATAGRTARAAGEA